VGGGNAAAGQAEYAGPKSDIRLRHRTLLVRRHCASCGTIIPDKYWSGYCRECYPAHRDYLAGLRVKRARDRKRRLAGKVDREWLRRTASVPR